MIQLRKNGLFLKNVSRETLGNLLNVLFFAGFLTLLYGCGEDSISEDVSGINKILSVKYDISSAEELSRFYHDYLYNNEEGKFTYELSPQTHGRVLVIMINHNPVQQNMVAEKFELLVKKNETTWKIVVVNRNWKCRGKDEWGIDPCN